MTKIRARAYIPSVTEYDKYFERFRAYMGAYVSKSAKKNSHGYDAYQNSAKAFEGKGWFPLRSVYAGTYCNHSYCGICGTDVASRCWDCDKTNDGGLRIALQLIYDENSDLMKSCRKDKRSCLVYDIPKYDFLYVTSKADILTFGKKEYIWLNEKEFREGKAKTMELWSLDLVTTAEPFDKDGGVKDYGNDAAKPLRDQCEKVAFEDCTKEELAMVAEVEMSSEDCYEKAVPVDKTLRSDYKATDGRSGK